MYSYAPDDERVRLEGALAADNTGHSLQPLRLPRAQADQIPSTFMRLMTECCAGVRLRLRTAATRIVATMIVEPFESIRVGPAFPAYVELYADGVLAGARRVGAIRTIVYDRDVDAELSPDGCDAFRPAPPSPRELVEFGGLGDGDKVIELVLPHTARVTLLVIEADRPLAEPGDDDRPRWVHYGSSISHCMEAERPSQTWPDIASRMLGYQLTNLAFAGNAQLDPCVARAIRDTPADVISLKLGINVVNSDSMNMRAFTAAVHGFIDTIRDGHPDTPLLVISPIACPAIEELPGPTGLDPASRTVASFTREPERPDKATLARIRPVLEAIVRARGHDDRKLGYLDGRELFSAADAHLLGDGLHPTAEGYGLIGKRFATAVRMRDL